MFRSEGDRVDYLVLVRIVGRWLDYSVDEGALLQRPTDVALPLINSVFGEWICLVSCIDYDLKAIDFLNADWIDHMANRKLDHFRCFTLFRRYVVLRQERSHLEGLLISETLLSYQSSRPSQRYFLNDTLSGLNLNLRREEHNDLRIVDQVNGVLRYELERDFGRLLYDFHLRIRLRLYLTADRSEGDIAICHCN